MAATFMAMFAERKQLSGAHRRVREHAAALEISARVLNTFAPEMASQRQIKNYAIPIENILLKHDGRETKMSVQDVLNKLTKWRGVFAGWQLGTRPNTDPECQAVRDHREVTILLRAEVSAITNILFRKGFFTEAEFMQQLGIEAQMLDKAYEKRFPGISTSQDGVELKMPEALETMKGWKP